MQLFSDRKLWFAGLGIIMALAFVSLRPLNAPTYRIIVADGLGYYSYLPAKFIYNDQDLNFEWFDEVFNRNYDNKLFEKPTENFMVKYHDKKINKYYPGQSLLQLPFFLLAHLSAKTLQFPADGFSLPYQLGMGIAALFYTLLGLFFCSKLLFNLFNNKMISIFVPLLIFFGTNLFTYAIFSGCYSHCYSFCFITLAFYSAWFFFNGSSQKIKWFLLTLLFSVIVVTIRPLNIVLLLGLMYFYRPVKRGEFSMNAGKTWVIPALSLVLLFVVFYSLDIIHRQTGSFLMNTYVGEKFYFSDWSHIPDNFFGFQYGILWYTPLIFISISTVFFVKQNPRILYLLIPVLMLIVLYSFWWYWNIVSRVIVDSSATLGILLAMVFVRFKNNKSAYRFAMMAAFICVPFFQLKAYQLRQGILDSNYTYSKYYFKHFLTLKDIDVFPVNPKTIIHQQDYFQDYENQSGKQISTFRGFDSKKSALLNSGNEFACTSTYSIPSFFKGEGFRKIRAAFWMFNTGEIKNIHLVFKFARQDSSLAYIPFYINTESRRDKWEYREFGIDLPGNVKPGDDFSVYFWNPDHKNEAFIDNLKVEFLLTDGSDEITYEAEHSSLHN